jgi:DNA mismatch repair ATPase MutS
MMQAGMFVPATSFSADVASGVFTHFLREEDATMTQGKLDEELDRMSRVVDLIGPRALLLCNESFGSTNEREGADIGEQVLRALTDAGVRVVLVTHLYELARRLSDNSTDGVLSLRAERLPDGTRTFKVREAGPLRTSFGNDVYAAVFGGVNPTAQGDATAEGTPV